jgi:hypothetical protein
VEISKRFVVAVRFVARTLTRIRLRRRRGDLLKGRRNVVYFYIGYGKLQHFAEPSSDLPMKKTAML